MEVVVTCEDEQAFQHLGHCEAFKVYEVENNKVLSSQVVGMSGNGHEILTVLLRNLGVETLIYGGIDGDTRTVLAQARIKLYLGAPGGTDEAVDALLKRDLAYDSNVICNHRHEGGERSCHGHGGSYSH